VDEATAFARWLSSATGIDSTLAHEAQWEKAARGTMVASLMGQYFDADVCNVRQPGRWHDAGR